MPEYILPILDIAKWNTLDAFTQGYIEAMFFTENDPSTYMDDWTPDHEFTDGSVPCDAGFDDLEPGSLARIISECKTFQKANEATLERAYDHESGYDEEQAGRDYWFTRNGHGVGFWDRGLGDVGDALDKACKYTNRDIWIGGHVVFGDQPFVHYE